MAGNNLGGKRQVIEQVGQDAGCFRKPTLLIQNVPFNRNNLIGKRASNVHRDPLSVVELGGQTVLI
jgi:hypothetical protein